MLSCWCLHNSQAWDRNHSPSWKDLWSRIQGAGEPRGKFTYMWPKYELKRGLIICSLPPLAPEMCKGRFFLLWSASACGIKRLLRLVHFTQGIISKFHNQSPGNPEMGSCFKNGNFLVSHTSVSLHRPFIFFNLIFKKKLNYEAYNILEKHSAAEILVQIKLQVLVLLTKTCYVTTYFL